MNVKDVVKQNCCHGNEDKHVLIRCLTFGVALSASTHVYSAPTEPGV